MIKIDKIFNGNSVNVVFCTNNKYAKYMMVALQSLISNTSKDRNYDIIIFETDMDTELKETVQKMGKDNISVRCLNVNSIYDEFKPYLDEEVEKNFAKYSDKEKEEMKYAAIFNVWEKAFINMTKDKNYILK